MRPHTGVTLCSHMHCLWPSSPMGRAALHRAPVSPPHREAIEKPHMKPVTPNTYDWLSSQGHPWFTRHLLLCLSFPSHYYYPSTTPTRWKLPFALLHISTSLDSPSQVCRQISCRLSQHIPSHMRHLHASYKAVRYHRDLEASDMSFRNGTQDWHLLMNWRGPWVYYKTFKWTLLDEWLFYWQLICKASFVHVFYKIFPILPELPCSRKQLIMGTKWFIPTFCSQSIEDTNFKYSVWPKDNHRTHSGGLPIWKAKIPNRMTPSQEPKHIFHPWYNGRSRMALPPAELRAINSRGITQSLLHISVAMYCRHLN